MARCAFLEISRELRDLIYHEALTSYVSEVYKERQRAGGFDGDEFFMDDCNFFPTSLPSTASSSLLLTSRKIHHEVKELVTRLQRTGNMEYELDCALGNECEIYPTWLLLPAPSPKIDVIKTSLRLYGELPKGNHSGWQDGCGGPGMMIWGLFELSRRFLTRGANFVGKHTSMNITIGLLILNVITPEEPAEGFIPEEKDVQVWKREAGGLINPKTMINLLTWNIERLLRYPQGNLLRERVGKISLCLDGEEKKDWIFP
jgi:hypothetical protein